MFNLFGSRAENVVYIDKPKKEETDFIDFVNAASACNEQAKRVQQTASQVKRNKSWRP